MLEKLDAGAIGAGAITLGGVLTQANEAIVTVIGLLTVVLLVFRIAIARKRLKGQDDGDSNKTGGDE